MIVEAFKDTLEIGLEKPGQTVVSVALVFDFTTAGFGDIPRSLPTFSSRNASRISEYDYRRS